MVGQGRYAGWKSGSPRPVLERIRMIHKTMQYRRWQAERAKERERRKWRQWTNDDLFGDSRLWDDSRFIGIQARTPRQCSCWMCGNPRKWWRWQGSLPVTRQERVADDRMVEELSCIFGDYDDTPERDCWLDVETVDLEECFIWWLDNRRE